MTLDFFKSTLTQPDPPVDLAGALRALWYDARDDWETAHRIAQDIAGEDGAWVHAYLHRKEGDAGNADYWYRRAGQPVATDSLGSEWDRIATTLLVRGRG